MTDPVLEYSMFLPIGENPPCFKIQQLADLDWLVLRDQYSGLRARRVLSPEALVECLRGIARGLSSLQRLQRISTSIAPRALQYLDGIDTTAGTQGYHLLKDTLFDRIETVAEELAPVEDICLLVGSSDPSMVYTGVQEGDEMVLRVYIASRHRDTFPRGLVY
jgi:hypothetical protein